LVLGFPLLLTPLFREFVKGCGAFSVFSPPHHYSTSLIGRVCLTFFQSPLSLQPLLCSSVAMSRCSIFPWPDHRLNFGVGTLFLPFMVVTFDLILRKVVRVDSSLRSPPNCVHALGKFVAPTSGYFQPHSVLWHRYSEYSLPRLNSLLTFRERLAFDVLPPPCHSPPGKRLPAYLELHPFFRSLAHLYFTRAFPPEFSLSFLIYGPLVFARLYG